jgi:head-tail adaptor
VQERTITQDTTGAAREHWRPVGSFWAEVRTKGGNETQASDATVALLTHQVTLRRQPGIQFRPTMLVTWGERNFQVTAVGEPDNRQRVVILDCYEVAA